MIHKDDLIAVAEVRKPHGTRGEMACTLLNDVLDRADPAFLILSVDNLLVPFVPEEYRYKGDDTLLLKLEDVDSEEAAQRLAGCTVYMEKRYLPAGCEVPLAPDTLIGFEVADTQHGRLGVITDVDTSTLNALFRLDGGLVFPAHDDFVVEINEEQRRLVVTLPEGLLSL
ncbi:MAG: 16S rRNA processing protein RimM [Paludibacteraceae bacterium]|nr:16S rRNA processing protein RimM [Paludibacteraceae bacterium]MBQ9704895.1 16S rRNA processing protein RimM [Paludibacteraceae bacterium]